MTNIDHPSMFKEGVRVLLLMLRAKDGGSAKTDRKATKKVITQSPAEFDEALSELRSLWQPDQRIYSTINARSIDKAVRLFKYRQLDADYFAVDDRNSFYLDLENRWVSCLKDSKAAIGSLFLFDIDNDNKDSSRIVDNLRSKPASILGKVFFSVVDDYATRGGRHIITTPFNPSTVEPYTQATLMKNALMLWSY